MHDNLFFSGSIKWILCCVFVFCGSFLLAKETADAEKQPEKQSQSEEKDSYGYDLSGKIGVGPGFIEGDGYKTEAAVGLNIEMAHRIYFGERDGFQLGVSPHLAYTLKGYQYDYAGESYLQSMHYLEVDFLSGYLTFFLKRDRLLFLNLMFGFPFAFLLDAEYSVREISVNNHHRFEVFDICAYGSVGVEISFKEHGRLTIDMRFESGLLDIFKSKDVPAYKQYSVFLNIGYIYNILSF